MGLNVSLLCRWAGVSVDIQPAKRLLQNDIWTSNAFFSHNSVWLDVDAISSALWVVVCFYFTRFIVMYTQFSIVVLFLCVCVCVCVFHPNDFAFAWHSFTLIRFSRVHRSVLCSCRRYSFLLHWCVRVCAPQPNESVKFLQIVDWNVYACHNSEAVGTMFYWLAIRNRNRNRSMNVNSSILDGIARSLAPSLSRSVHFTSSHFDWFFPLIYYLRIFNYPTFWIHRKTWMIEPELLASEIFLRTLKYPTEYSPMLTGCNRSIDILVKVKLRIFCHHR